MAIGKQTPSRWPSTTTTTIHHTATTTTHTHTHTHTHCHRRVSSARLWHHPWVASFAASLPHVGVLL
eukprot:NODE_10333_length_290_cov_2.634855_g8565_i0.p2 GENE.NODE_10333_length_290_cov_2.634855_g8565_i0~~NODE_10333_length_290_cov_2.634855_g8565_i0.p2  ORF type:complete len:67 (+),score=2.40 NODE_10333_length_290_cov_2.634855_g8565_i0:52-252(+)